MKPGVRNGDFVLLLSRNIFYLIALLSLLYVTPAYAERGGIVVAKKISLDKKVLFLNTLHGERVFTVGWIDGNGRVWEKRHVSRRGFHAYEMRNHPAWNGTAGSVSVIGIKVDSARVDFPDIRAEMDIFLAFEPWMRSTVNALWGHTLFGFSWDRVLLVAGLLFATVIFRVKRASLSPAGALLCGFVFLMILMDIRTTWDHISMAEKLDENESIAQTRGLASFSRQLSGRIGDTPWSYEKLPAIAAINIAYGLAEKQYSPLSLTGRLRYLISYDNGAIVLIPPGRQPVYPGRQ